MTSPRANENLCAAEHAADVLLEQGVRHVFVYANASVEALLEALRKRPSIELIQLRSEQAVAFAAAGYARSTGRVGVCLTGGGPAATSLLTGILDAQLDSVPLVLLAGQTPARLIGTDAWQECDTIGMTASVTKHNFQPRSGDEVGAMVEAALQLASRGRRGPVFVDLPSDILRDEVREPLAAARLLRGVHAPAAPAPEDVEAVAELLSDAERPLLLLGGGVVAAEAGAAWLDFAEALHIPVANTMTAKGVISELHPHAVGMLGLSGRRAALWAYQNCDLLLAVGCRFAERLTGDAAGFARDKRVAHIDIDAVELGKTVAVDASICADAAAALPPLEEAMKRRAARAVDEKLRQQWLNQCATAAGFCLRCVPHRSESRVHPKRIMDMINQRRRSDEIVCTGSGSHQAFAAHFLLHQRPRTFLSSCGTGARGFGLPAAIGAAVGNPKQRIVLIDGDAGFQTNIQELATIAERNLQVISIVLDNGSMAEAIGLDDASPLDFAPLAGAWGIAGYHVSSESELEDLLDELWQERKAAVIHVETEAMRLSPSSPLGATIDAYAGNCVPDDRPGLFNEVEERILEEAVSGRREDEP